MYGCNVLRRNIMKKTILSTFIGLALLSGASMAMAGEAPKFDPYTQGAINKADPYTDGAKIGKFDPYTDGAKAGKFDVYTDGLKLNFDSIVF